MAVSKRRRRSSDSITPTPPRAVDRDAWARSRSRAAPLPARRSRCGCRASSARRSRRRGSPQPPPPAVPKVSRSPGASSHAGRLAQPLLAAVVPDQHRLVDGAGLAAGEAPGRILRALVVDVGDALLQRPIGQVDAEPAAMLPGAAGIRAQGKALDQERILDLLQLDRRAAHVALADRDARRTRRPRAAVRPSRRRRCSSAGSAARPAGSRRSSSRPCRPCARPGCARAAPAPAP